MRILYIIPPAPKVLEPYPVEKYVQELVREVRRRGLEASVLLPEMQAGSFQASPGVRVLTWPEGEFAATARRIMREIRPHAVQIENDPKLVRPLRQFYEGQLVLNLHSLQGLAGYNISRSELRVALCLVDKIVVASHFLKSLFIGRYYGLRLRAFTIHPSVDTASFSPYWGNKLWEKERALLRKQWGVEGELVALVPPYPNFEQGLAVLLKALGEGNVAKAYKFIIAPALPLSEHLGNEMLRLKELIICLEPSDLARLPMLYRAADAVFYPSQGREAVGIANLQALASGVPVVASMRGGITEVINDTCGYLVRQYNQPHAWAKVMGQIANEKDTLVLLGQNARKRSLEYTWERAVNRFMQVYSV